MRRVNCLLIIVSNKIRVQNDDLQRKTVIMFSLFTASQDFRLVKWGQNPKNFGHPDLKLDPIINSSGGNFF